MTEAEIIYRAMVLMVKANAKYTGVDRTERLQWRNVRVDYYPASDRWSWFGRDDLPRKHDVLAAIDACLR